ncbi:Protein CBR-ECH-2 [Caenorhabditis briggsae]|uniref:Enoyl-CoA hydratase domain-containing protein 3, mitochondrial n=1 Tax=Caenorhabditis briggsae TaxID=6238 RepID=A8X0R0_CAEBR|nr:Protein CBR-ECH-2 [Caenorhabditis briggsae]CAP26220.1 Protein CBR-ECH-2 [Caenorhabditis briggsae]
MLKISIRGFSTSTAARTLLDRELYQENSVVRFILNDKKMNTLSLAMIKELFAELKAIDKIEKVRSVVIAHNGKSFSAGHELKELTTESGTDKHNEIFNTCGDMMNFIRNMKVPVIAEVNGTAAAAGLQFVASCDVVVAGKSSRFLVPGQKLGLFCSTPGIALVRAVPKKVAMDMLLTAQPIDSEAALRAGLVSRVVDDDQVKFEALKVAEQIGQFSRSVTSLGKAFFYTQAELGTADAYRYGSRVMVGNLKLKDCQEGISAFIGKRHPEFEHSNDLVEETKKN